MSMCVQASASYLACLLKGLLHSLKASTVFVITVTGYPSARTAPCPSLHLTYLYFRFEISATGTRNCHATGTCRAFQEGKNLLAKVLDVA